MPPVSVRIVKNWDYPDLMQQSPQGSGVWQNIRVFEGDGAADFVVVLNQPAVPTEVFAPRNRIWAVIQEPPTPFHRFLHRGQKSFGRIYTTDSNMRGDALRYRPSQPALAWHVGLSFDELDAMTAMPAKTKDVSWITSTLAFLPGHKNRLRLIEQLKPSGLIDFFGRGLNPIPRKWEGLAPYRYSIAFENHVGPYYWSEKLADCFLAGAMPIYVGCTNLEDYFPQGSFVRLDPKTNDPAGVIRKIIESDLAERNRDAVIEARRRVLHEHQLFPFLAKEIAAFREDPQDEERLGIRVQGMRNPFVYGMAVWYWKVKPLVRGIRR